MKACSGDFVIDTKMCHIHVSGKLDPIFFKIVQCHPHLAENIDRAVSVHHSLVPFGTPRAIPRKRCLI